MSLYDNILSIILVDSLTSPAAFTANLHDTVYRLIRNDVAISAPCHLSYSLPSRLAFILGTKRPASPCRAVCAFGACSELGVVLGLQAKRLGWNPTDTVRA